MGETMSETATLPTNKAIGAAIRLLRTQAGLTQDRLSRDSGLSQASISQIERGSRLDLDNLRSLAGPLGLSVWQLLRMAEMLDKGPGNIGNIIRELVAADAALEPAEMEALAKKMRGE